MDRDAVLNDLFSRQNRGIKPGLARIEAAAKELGNPQNRFQTVHVAGTNGKGSTSTMTAAVLQEAGFRTGLFTSPHILEFRERFIIDGSPVSDDLWLSVWSDIQPVCDAFELTFFEISTLIAFELFAREKCSWVVLETGMGGRLDSTNICDPAVSVITAISVEHTEYLGDTIEKIASEKLGIIKKGRPAVINGANPKAVLDLAEKSCIERESCLTAADPELFSLIKKNESGQILTYKNGELSVPLAGDFQIQNTACAVTACELLGISPETIRSGIAKAFIPCRLQKMEIGGQPWIFDVAHNPQAIEILCTSLTGKVHFLTGMMKDKDYESMLAMMIPHALSITVIQPSIPRSASAQDLAEAVRKQAPHIELTAETVRSGVELFMEKEGTHVVTGSFYTISDVFGILNCSPWDR